ncbi:MAG: hypothetical protein QG577_2501 [Thermodesulfobacteriota bacterium]|nr:hypothetical protein [Thermodesulfobacteriota bacterium]
MKIVIPQNHLGHLIDRELDVVIHARHDAGVEVYQDAGVIRPDRHFLIGMVQLSSVAIEEKDGDFVSFVRDQTITLNQDGHDMPIGEGLFIFKTTDGQVGCLSSLDPRSSLRLVRVALRQLTGTIRLDVP